MNRRGFLGALAALAFWRRASREIAAPACEIEVFYGVPGPHDRKFWAWNEQLTLAECDALARGADPRSIRPHALITPH